MVQQGIPIATYQVLLSFKLTRVGDPIFEKAHDNAFKSSIPEQYRVRELDALETCDVPNIDLDKTKRTFVVDDPDNPSDALGEIGTRLGPTDCEQIEPTEHRIGTLFAYPEWKIEWVMRDVHIGRCRIVRTKLPVLYTRTTRKVLYGVVLSPRDAKRLLERVFLDCMETSAIVGGLLILIAGGTFEAGLSAFQIAMNACLTKKVPEAIKRCLISDLAILTSVEDWKRV